ncbi:MAG TPA: pentapeptide repeat-containing protein [Caldithrix abyssi]|uniref:Pentapeptide repeat-containing protein n=1 Tax=Caldithrix abyssi TaxID=187145 RepID=A0A7V5PPB5_CALAY|nr:pentapeptide repeat-containing protein [Caldithrix abyssi]
MVNETPKMPKDHRGYTLLRERRVAEFNDLYARGIIDNNLSGLDFRGSDLRGLNADGLNLSNSKFKQADLRGINFSTANLAGASLYGAKISGCLFPESIGAQEIMMSVQYGTRLRVK